MTEGLLIFLLLASLLFLAINETKQQRQLARVIVRIAGTVDGVDIDRPGIRDGIAFIPQDKGLIETMTVAENLALFAKQGWLVSPGAEHRRATEFLGDPVKRYRGALCQSPDRRSVYRGRSRCRYARR